MATTASFLYLLSPPGLRPKPVLRPRLRRLAVSVSPSGPDEIPADDPPVLPSILIKNTEPEDVARRRSWVKHGWAPWEEVMTPEVAFARHCLNEGEEVPLQSPESLEAFRMLTPWAISVMQFDQDYYPGRRKRGKDYREDMVCPVCFAEVPGEEPKRQ